MVGQNHENRFPVKKARWKLSQAANNLKRLKDREEENNPASKVKRIADLDLVQMAPLVAASRKEGFRFIARLWDDWAKGTNRFDQPGEALFGLVDEAHLVGVGGINRQSETSGRIRRFYILPTHRRRGLGRALLNHILSHAAGHFRCVVLRTDTIAADLFYVACGFARKRAGEITHEMELISLEPSEREKC